MPAPRRFQVYAAGCGEPIAPIDYLGTMMQGPCGMRYDHGSRLAYCDSCRTDIETVTRLLREHTPTELAALVDGSPTDADRG